MEFIEIISEPRRQQFSDLLDRAFRLAPGTHYLEDFPIWGAERPDLARFGAVSEDGELVASVGVRQVLLRAREGGLGGSESTLKAALIGAVATEERFRGQRLASRLVGQALEWAENRGAEIALLWGAEHSLYGHLGFALSGTQALLPLAELGAVPASTLQLRRGWNRKIFDQLMRREDGVVLTLEDLGWYEAHRHVEWYWVGPLERPEAYAAIGRGIDLTRLVHEWGGEPEALRFLLTALEAERPGELTLLSLLQGLESLGIDLKAPQTRARQEYLFLAKILRPERLEPGCFGTPGQPGSTEVWIWGLDAV